MVIKINYYFLDFILEYANLFNKINKLLFFDEFFLTILIIVFSCGFYSYYFFKILFFENLFIIFYSFPEEIKFYSWHSELTDGLYYFDPVSRGYLREDSFLMSIYRGYRNLIPIRFSYEGGMFLYCLIACVTFSFIVFFSDYDLMLETMGKYTSTKMEKKLTADRPVNYFLSPELKLFDDRKPFVNPKLNVLMKQFPGPFIPWDRDQMCPRLLDHLIKEERKIPDLFSVAVFSNGYDFNRYLTCGVDYFFLYMNTKVSAYETFCDSYLYQDKLVLDTNRNVRLKGKRLKYRGFFLEYKKMPNF